MPPFLLSQSGGLVRIFCPVVQSLVLSMLYTRQDLAFRCSVALQFTGNDHARDLLEFFEKLPKKSFRRFSVASALDQDIESLSILIHSTPEGVFLPTNRENYLVHMPFVPTARATSPQFIGVRLPKSQAPLPNRFLNRIFTNNFSHRTKLLLIL
jgi:hypothetical protein